MKKKSKKWLYLLLMLGLPILLAIIFFFIELEVVDNWSDASNPQDVTGALAIFAPVAALVGAVLGFMVGGSISLALYFSNRSKN